MFWRMVVAMGMCTAGKELLRRLMVTMSTWPSRPSILLRMGRCASPPNLKEERVSVFAGISFQYKRTSEMVKEELRRWPSDPEGRWNSHCDRDCDLSARTVSPLWFHRRSLQPRGVNPPPSNPSIAIASFRSPVCLVWTWQCTPWRWCCTRWSTWNWASRASSVSAHRQLGRYLWCLKVRLSLEMHRARARTPC